MVECVNLKLRLEAHTVGYLAGEANAYELEEREYEKKLNDKLSNIKASNIKHNDKDALLAVAMFWLRLYPAHAWNEPSTSAVASLSI